MSPPAVSRAAIVVTCFNDGATLGETIASIRAGAADAELVVVDDGSTDAATLALLESLERDGTRVIHQPNQGQAAAAMTGVRASSAPYVMRFDADDLLEPGALDALAEALDGAPSAAAAWGDVQTFGLTNFRIPSVPGLDPWLVSYTNCVTGSGNLLRRRALEAAGGWQLRSGFEDWDLCMRLAELGYAGVHVPRVVFRYRRDRAGALAGWLGDTERHYEVLRGRHPDLFLSRRLRRRESAAPIALKLLIPVIDALPRLPRLTKIHACEFLARLLWGGGVQKTVPMLWQALAIRLPVRGPGYGADRG